jgi:peptide/nickel transport system permease protein
MLRYLIGRIAQAAVVVLLVTLVVFAILHFLPGNPARAMLGIKASPGAIRAFDVANGYNRPLPVQYALYLDRLLHGNLGFSYHFNQSVASLLALDVPKTGLLVGAAYVFALLVAIPVGLLQALRRGKPVDHTITTLAFIGYAMPSFWLGFLLIALFSVQFHVLPPEGPQGASVGAVLHDPEALVLPVLTLTVITVALFSRFMRSSTIETLLQDFVRTARAKGMSTMQLVSRHVVRNSLLPVVTLIGLSFPYVISGAVVVEALFNYPGMGWLFWSAAQAQDYPVLLGFTVVVGTATVVGNLLADVAYALLDPRIRYGGH